MICIVDEKRSDAIGIYTREFINAANSMHIDTTNFLLENNCAISNKLFRKCHELTSTFKISIKLKNKSNIIFIDPKKLYVLSALASNRPKTLIVHHIDDTPPAHFLFNNKVMAYFFNTFDAVIAISESTKSSLHKLGIKTEKVHTVYNGIDHSTFYPRTKNPHPNSPFILFVGTELPRKNFTRALDTFSILLNNYPDLKLIKIGGPGNDENRKITLNKIQSLNLDSKVIFTEFIPNDLLTEYYSHAKLLLFPTLLEGFGFPIVEAMACGCPVITSNIPPMNELAATEELLVNPYEVEDIVTKCKLLLSDSALTKKTKAAGITKAKMFSWQETVKSITTIINAL